MSKVKPLRKRTMALRALRTRTVKTLKACRSQLRGKAWSAGGKTDEEFIHDVIESLIMDIEQDIEIEKKS